MLNDQPPWFLLALWCLVQHAQLLAALLNAYYFDIIQSHSPII